MRGQPGTLSTPLALSQGCNAVDPGFGWCISRTTATIASRNHDGGCLTSCTRCGRQHGQTNRVCRHRRRSAPMSRRLRCQPSSEYHGIPVRSARSPNCHGTKPAFRTKRARRTVSRTSFTRAHGERRTTTFVGWCGEHRVERPMGRERLLSSHPRRSDRTPGHHRGTRSR